MTKENGRDGIHVEERAMIGDEQERARNVYGVEMFEAVNLHQVISRQMNPERADVSLTPRPETFPTSLIHLMRLKKSETLYP
jgi:hypothetical protein